MNLDAEQLFMHKQFSVSESEGDEVFAVVHFVILFDLIGESCFTECQEAVE